MRHFYFRLILGVVFIACMIFSFVTMNIPFALLYLALGAVFLFSAYSLWKKNKDNRR
jgi:predicted membrane protein